MQFKVQNTKIKSCGLVQQNKLWLLLLLIREVAKEFKGEIRCLDENTEKYVTFFIINPKNNKMQMVRVHTK